MMQHSRGTYAAELTPVLSAATRLAENYMLLQSLIGNSSTAREFPHAAILMQH
jgi:hypothetical protein